MQELGQDSKEVKLLLSYDPIPGLEEDYFNYVLGEFVPSMEHLGLRMVEAWHTAYGPYPLRLTGFIAPDRTTLEIVLRSGDFQSLEDRLQKYVLNYNRRIVPKRRKFQF
jgi:hypothetical protein